MVKDWRKQLGLGDIPFYAVEIAPYDYDDPDEHNKAPMLREAQWKAIEMIPNSDMISINDLVQPFELHNIHPGNKAAAGKRLCDLALNKTYGKTQFPATSPRYKSHTFKEGAAWVLIDSPCDGICRNYMIEGFEVAGEDKVFHPADSVWLHWQTNEMVVSSKEVPNPVAVRYCWKDFLPGTLHSGNYLPLIPFRTDNW
jgi:sialate O-acetylesterase